MRRIATADFAVTDWNEEDWDEEDWDEEDWDEDTAARLSRAHVRKSFNGEIEGSSVAELLLATAVEGSGRAYVGFERIVAVVNGRRGSFVLHHTATTSHAGQAVSWQIVPDSGTGDLAGIRGEAQIVVGSDGRHMLTLDYELD